MKKITTLISASLLNLGLLNATVWNVGPLPYTLPSQVKPLVSNGDTINIAGGTYNNDAVKWDKKNLKFFGLGTPSNPTIIKYTGNIPNGKGIWVFEQPGISDNPYIENITFDGAQVSDSNGGNGAGIRFQSKDITIKNCKFINCQNGILDGNGSVSTSNVYLEGCEFYNNGYAGTNTALFGYEHHIYISASTDSLWVKNCFFHSPRGEANSLKTRAQRNWILNNYIDEESGDGSWELDLSQGGLCIVIGNVIIQGPSGANHGIINLENATNPINQIYLVNNTVINKYVGNVRFFVNSASSGITTFKFRNNIFASTTGASNIWLQGAPSVVDTSNNRYLTNYTTVGFNNAAAGDYSISPTALSLVNNGINAGNSSTGYPLTPAFMYSSYSIAPTPHAVSGGSIDIGAYEYVAPVTTNLTNQKNASVLLNSYFINDELTLSSTETMTRLSVLDLTSKQVFFETKNNMNNITIDMQNFAMGVYIVKAETESGKTLVKKIYYYK